VPKPAVELPWSPDIVIVATQAAENGKLLASETVRVLSAHGYGRLCCADAVVHCVAKCVSKCGF